ncbi:TPA: HNH endonuclease [Candidatus Poribacteria bacterium]|nr:HNH endonuclease [Candidatus Poribacteria bacterium]
MRRPRISSKLRAKIMEEARYRCGYCLMQQIATNWILEVEHIIPTALGGTDDEENLWLSCPACNRYKGAKVKARDPETGRKVRLFNPRRQKWERHFRFSYDGTKIIGLTACGRSTIEALRLNNELAKQARAIWRNAGIHPPKD